MDNILIIVAIVLIIGLASFYVYKAKKSGAKCIGCPEGCTCGREKSCENKQDE